MLRNRGYLLSYDSFSFLSGVETDFSTFGAAHTDFRNKLVIESCQIGIPHQSNELILVSLNKFK